jgi:hypothetical protein
MGRGDSKTGCRVSSRCADRASGVRDHWVIVRCKSTDTALHFARRTRHFRSCAAQHTQSSPQLGLTDDTASSWGRIHLCSYLLRNDLARQWYSAQRMQLASQHRSELGRSIEIGVQRYRSATAWIRRNLLAMNARLVWSRRWRLWVAVVLVTMGLATAFEVSPNLLATIVAAISATGCQALAVVLASRHPFVAIGLVEISSVVGESGMPILSPASPRWSYSTSCRACMDLW